MMELLRPVILVIGLCFILVGLNIAMLETPQYEGILTPLHIFVMWVLYIVLFVLFLGLLSQAYNYLKNSGRRG